MYVYSLILIQYNLIADDISNTTDTVKGFWSNYHGRSLVTAETDTTRMPRVSDISFLGNFLGNE